MPTPYKEHSATYSAKKVRDAVAGLEGEEKYAAIIDLLIREVPMAALQKANQKWLQESGTLSDVEHEGWIEFNRRLREHVKQIETATPSRQ